MRTNLIVLLADLFNLFEIHPAKCVTCPGPDQRTPGKPECTMIYIICVNPRLLLQIGSLSISVPFCVLVYDYLALGQRLKAWFNHLWTPPFWSILDFSFPWLYQYRDLECRIGAGGIKWVWDYSTTWSELCPAFSCDSNSWSAKWLRCAVTIGRHFGHWLAE